MSPAVSLMPERDIVRVVEEPPSGVRTTVRVAVDGRVWGMSIRVAEAGDMAVPGATFVLPWAAARVTSGCSVKSAGVEISLHTPDSSERVPDDGMPERVMEVMVHGGSASPAENVTAARAWLNVRAQGDSDALTGVARSRSGCCVGSEGTVKAITGSPGAVRSGIRVIPLAA